MAAENDWTVLLLLPAVSLTVVHDHARWTKCFLHFCEQIRNHIGVSKVDVEFILSSILRATETTL